MAISRRQFTAGALAGLAGYLPGRLEALRPRPKLFVFLIAEQFRQLYLDRGESLLAPGGFRELMTKGVYYPDCRLAASGFTPGGRAHAGPRPLPEPPRLCRQPGVRPKDTFVNQGPRRDAGSHYFGRRGRAYRVPRGGSALPAKPHLLPRPE